MRARDILGEKWSAKYKRSIDCSHPKGFSQRAHCADRTKTNESVYYSDKVSVCRGWTWSDVDELCEGTWHDPDEFDRVTRKNLQLPEWTSTLQLWGAYHPNNRRSLNESTNNELRKDIFKTFSSQCKNSIESVKVGQSVALLHLQTLDIPGDKLHVRLRGFTHPRTVVDIIPQQHYTQLKFSDGSVYPQSDDVFMTDRMQSVDMTKLFASEEDAEKAVLFYRLRGNKNTQNLDFRIQIDSSVSGNITKEDHTSADIVDYVIYVNNKPATVYDTREQAQRDLDLVKEKYPHKQFEIKRRVRSEKVDEDAGSSPGGVSPNTKMVCEIDDEQPYIKAWRDRNGIKHWEVYDWRGAFQQRFSSRRAAQEWLDTHWDKLSESSKWTTLRPQQLRGSYSDSQLRSLGFKQNPDTKQWYMLTTQYDKLVKSGQLK